MLSEAFTKLKSNKFLLIFPIGFDFLAFFLGIALIGFYGQSKMTIRFVLDVGMPSVSTLIDQKVNFMLNGFNLNLNSSFEEISSLIIFSILLSFIIGSFLQAGFIGLLNNTIQAKPLSFSRFITFGKKYWYTYLFIELIWYALLLAAFFLLILPLGILGLIIFGILIITLRIVFIYWEFTVIVDDLSVFDALTQAKIYFANRSRNLISILIYLVGFNLLLSLLVNGLWNPIVLLISIFIYGYVSTGLQLSLMITLYDAKNRVNHFDNIE
jgi:hypothetical protein